MNCDDLLYDLITERFNFQLFKVQLVYALRNRFSCEKKAVDCEDDENYIRALLIDVHPNPNSTTLWLKHQCMTEGVILTDKMAEAMNLEDPKSEESILLLHKIAEVFNAQGSYHLACKKYTQAGDRLAAMKVSRLFGCISPKRSIKDF